MGKEENARLILRILDQREATGSDVHRKLEARGVKAYPNHLYVQLNDMEQAGLLQSRWEGDGPQRRRLYSLAPAGKAAHRELVKEAVSTLMDAFVAQNGLDMPGHVSGLRWFLEHARIGEPSGRRPNIVVAVPAYDPLTCFGAEFRVFAEAFPRGLVHVVKPPGVDMEERHPRLRYLDGFRHAMPLPDRFASQLWLEGFPSAAPPEKTLVEARRVLREGGDLAIMASEVRDVKRPIKAQSLAEFAASMFYEHHGEDAFVDLDEVRRVVRAEFADLREFSAYGNAILVARVPGQAHEDEVDLSRTSSVLAS